MAAAAAAEQKGDIEAFAIMEQSGPVTAWSYTPNPLAANQVEVSISHSGVCHSDLHQQHNDWGGAHYPLVVGHEIVGTITAVGSDVQGLKVGQRVGVGPQTGSCGDCRECQRGEQQFCPGKDKSYNTRCKEEGPQEWTYGGFARAIRVKAAWAFPIPDGLGSAGAAPLLCAGVTTWTPLVTGGCLAGGLKVGIVGIGGLGHVAVQFAAKMGNEVVAISRSKDKAAHFSDLGASSFLDATDGDAMKAAAGTFDFLLSTISANGVNWDSYLQLLKPDGTLAMVGLPTEMTFNPKSVVVNRLKVVGSYLANHLQIQDMLEFAAKHGVNAHIEELPMSVDGCNEALKKVHENTVRYRAVLVNEQYGK